MLRLKAVQKQGKVPRESKFWAEVQWTEENKRVVCINVARRGGGGAVAIKIHFKSVTETNHF